jgi:broad specificity phosphatase PhoE
MSVKKFILISACIILGSIILLSSLINLYVFKDKIALMFKGVNSEDRPLNNSGYTTDISQIKLANDIISKGGYILYFRHAHREKWIDVAMYDAMEAIDNLDASELYFKDAVCLSKMGLIQAMMMGEFLKKIKLPIGQIITSPSCRARQTSELLFGSVGKINNLLLHPGPYNEKLKDFRRSIRNLILSLEPENKNNSIISAHNGVIKREIFDEVYKDIHYNLEEGGFYVMKKINNKLILIDKFHNFNHFNQILFSRPK